MTEGLFVLLALYITIPWAASHYYNRSFIGWFLLTLFITPVLSFFALAWAGEKEDPNQALIDEVKNLKEELTKENDQ